jgi:diguanylate cyclase
MSALLIKLLFFGTSAAIGAIAGWWIRGVESHVEPAPTPQPNPESISEDDPVAETVDEETDSDAVDTMMAQLQQLTATVAADVGEHSSKVQEINDELSAMPNDATSVVSIIEKLVQANGAMQSQLAEAETRLHDQSQEIKSHVKDARTDALTKLWNRRHFDDEMRKAKESFDQSDLASCVMMLDVDHFKKFNDTYGHQAGDEVLKGVARTLRKAAGKNTVCRYGGEEFAIVFRGLDTSAAMSLAERARAAISEQVFEFEGMDLKVTASGGLAQLQRDESVADAVKRADDSLYVCKANGRDCGYWNDGDESHRMEIVEEATPGQAESEHDPVTGLCGRIGFHNDLVQRIAESKRDGGTLSVVFVEIDDYASIISSHGDKASGVVLRAAAQFLKAAMRDMDYISRYDDHLFGLLFPNAEIAAANSVAERLRTAIARCSLPVDGKQVSFTVSMGAAQIATSDSDASLVARAQSSLAAAREAGGNCCHVAEAADAVPVS